MRKKILITGTNSYIGTSFEKYIARKNAAMPPEDQWHIMFLSVRDDSWREKSFADYDAILHVAGIVHRREQPEMEALYQKVNTVLTRELAEKYKRDRSGETAARANFVFLSTMSVYGIVRGQITNRTDPSPVNFYGKSKLQAEEELFKLIDDNFIVSIVRPPMIYGYKCTGNYAALERLAEKIPLFPKVKNQRSMLYIENLCEFLRLLMANDGGKSNVYCPQNKEYVNTSRLVAEIRSTNGAKMHLVPGFAGLTGFLAGKIKIFSKVFGSLTYEMDMSVYPELGDYQIVSFEESVKLSSRKADEENQNFHSPSEEAETNAPDSEMPKVSVLMSLYIKEKPEYFKAAMDSILEQTYPADEIMLMEDGPLTDELYRAVEEYKLRCEKDERYPTLRIHAFEENQQLGRALAKGVELCSNELIARMDTDDIAMPDRLEKQVMYMHRHPKVSVLGGAIREFNDEGSIDREKQMPKTQDEIQQYIKLRNPLNHMTVLYRRSAILEAGNYCHFPYLEDYFLWSRMVAKDYQIRNLEDVLVKARTSMELVKRRSGWGYFKNFKRLRRQQHELGLTSVPEYWKAVTASFVMIVQPGFVKEFAYKKFLRK